jgi:hypothetical protein
MPAAVASRLDATLADLRRAGPPTPGQPVRPRAAPGRTGSSSPVAGTGPATVGDLDAARERRRRRLTRSLGGVAAAIAVIAAGASVTALIRTGGGSAENNTSSAAGSARSGTKDSAGAGAVPPDASTLSPGITLAVPSYDRSTLRSALPTIAQQSAVNIITGRGDTGPAGVMADTARRTACAGTIRGSSGELQAVQRIRYDGMPAYVFVFDDNGQQTGYVVSDTCGISSALPATVLDTVS